MCALCSVEKSGDGWYPAIGSQVTSFYRKRRCLTIRLPRTRFEGVGFGLFHQISLFLVFPKPMLYLLAMSFHNRAYYARPDRW